MSDVTEVDAVILAGGKGTRLQSVVSDRPKPMAVACGRPFLEWLFLSLCFQGVHRAVLATGYMGDVIESYFESSSRFGLDLSFSREMEPLGTGGAIRHALGSTSTDPILVLNGDSFCRFDLKTLTQAHSRSGAQATLWLVPVEDCARYGSVEIDAGGTVTAFHEKSRESRTGLVSAGVYLLDRQLIEVLPPERPVSLERDLFPDLIGRGLHAVVGEGPFIDIGTPESYAAAESFFAPSPVR